jgi:hypothetical protein
LEEFAFLGEGDEVAIPLREPGVFQVGTVHQRPLAAAIVVGPAVALAGEIEPFGVAECPGERFTLADMEAES